MLLPRFSILWMLGFTAFCAVVSLVLANAVRGEFWAIGAMAALGSGVLLVMLYVLAFLVAWIVAQIEAAMRVTPDLPSPFRTGTVPVDSSLNSIAPPLAADTGDNTPPPMTG